MAFFTDKVICLKNYFLPVKQLCKELKIRHIPNLTSPTPKLCKNCHYVLDLNKLIKLNPTKNNFK